MPDYSKIIAVFNRIEAEFPVDAMTYKGMCVWPLIRFDIASQLFWQRQEPFEDNRSVFEQECYAASESRGFQGKYASIVIEKTKAALRTELVPLLQAIAPAELALLTIGFEYTLIEGRYYNRFFDPLKDIAEDANISCSEILTGFQGNSYENTFSDKVMVATGLARAQQVMREFMLANPVKELIDRFGDFLEYLNGRGITVSVNHEQLTARLDGMLAQSFVFEAVLERIQPRLAFVVCYYHDTAMAFLLACRKAGIPAVDMQHSVICNDDWGWAQWNSVPVGGYEMLPRYFWAWGETFAEITRCWSTKSASNLAPVVGGNVWIPAWRRQFSNVRSSSKLRPFGSEKVILYAVPFGDARMFREIFPDEVLDAIRHSPPELKWLIRIHYKTDDSLMAQIRGYLARNAGELDVHRSSEIQLYELLESVDYHVSQTCTTVIEAEEFGIPNIIIGTEGRKWYQNEIDNGYYLYARSSEELIGTILEGRKPIARPERLLCTESLEAKKALAFLLDTNQEKEPLQEEAMNKSPHIFTIETTLACDLRCPECAIGGGMIRRAKGLMTFGQYKIIADKIRPYAQYVYLHIWGEPMLNPDIFEMIQYTAQFARTNISTNGMSLTPEKAEALILSGVSDIIVSIDGVSQEVYEQYRVGGNVHKAFESLALLNEINRKYGHKVNILPQFVVFQHNMHEMEAFARRCSELGLHPSFKAPYIRTGDSRFSYCEMPAYRRPHFSDIGDLRVAMQDCPNPREVFTTLEDGSVVVCCHDYAGATHFGNIFEQDVLEIWNHPDFKRFRHAILSGKAPVFCVNNCMTWFLDKTTEAPKDMKDAMANGAAPKMINLCCGPVRLPGFVNIDITPGGDIQLDLERELLPFPDESMDAVICISAINYFSYRRGAEIIKDVFRVLKPGGVARFATQDLRILAGNYLDRTSVFYHEKLADGRDRFPGKTVADKFNEFFYGFCSGNKHCNYVYDYESLAVHFREAGFGVIEQKEYRNSRIPGADTFDNRPEQMFFLEAVKRGTSRSVLQTAQDFWTKGLREQAWQYILKALDENPDNREAVDLCANILDELGRVDDITKLYRSYLAQQPNDLEIRHAFEANESKLQQQSIQEQSVLPERRGRLEQLNFRRNSILTDREHLAACMAWLRRAQEANDQGGVSAVYYMDKERWEVDYPETTGYIITTFLTYYRLTGDGQQLLLAKKMGDWEIEIQTPDGGVGEPVGVYGLKPRVFNTGQVMLGWVALFRETSDARYLDAARKAGDWILSSLDPDGKWSRNTYQGPRAYKSRVSWALLELFSACGEEKYREGAELSLSWILSQAQYNGWFENNSLTEPSRPWTHLIGYVLVGLLEICRLNNARVNRNQILKLLHNAALGMIKHYLTEKQLSKGNFVTLAATFDRDWGSDDAWTCVTGTTQVEFFLRRLANFVDNPALVKTADMIVDDIKQLQFIDGITDPNMFGGLPGAFPIGVGYATYSIPNWGVKFFADSLLQRLLPLEQQIVIG